MFISGNIDPISAELENKVRVFRDPDTGFVFYVPREQLMGQAAGLSGFTLNGVQDQLFGLNGQMTAGQKKEYVTGAMLNYTAG